MDREQVEQAILDRLKEREKQVVNRNALDALLSVLKLDSLSKIFLGRKDALEAEKLRIEQEIVLDLLCRIDDAISGAKTDSSRQKIDWTIISGEIEAYGEDVEEVTAMSIATDAGPTELKSGTHIRASGKRSRRVTALDIERRSDVQKEGE